MPTKNVVGAPKNSGYLIPPSCAFVQGKDSEISFFVGFVLVLPHVNIIKYLFLFYEWIYHVQNCNHDEWCCYWFLTSTTTFVCSGGFQVLACVPRLLWGPGCRAYGRRSRTYIMYTEPKAPRTYNFYFCPCLWWFGQDVNKQAKNKQHHQVGEPSKQGSILFKRQLFIYLCKYASSVCILMVCLVCKRFFIILCSWIKLCGEFCVVTSI